MSDSEAGRPLDVDFPVPDELRGGVYANAANVWYSPYEFTLDWGVYEPVEIEDSDELSSAVGVVAIVVARVRIPVALMYDVLRGLNQAMTDYERDYGEIRRPWE